MSANQTRKIISEIPETENPTLDPTAAGAAPEAPPAGVPVKHYHRAEWTAPAGQVQQPGGRSAAPRPGQIILTDDELDDDAAQLDPNNDIDDFIAVFGEYAEQGYQLSLVRLPDPGHLAGRFRTECLDMMSYGQIPFRPSHLVQDIQKYLKSGGKVRVNLKDRRNHYLRGAFFTGIIPDPPESVALDVQQHLTQALATQPHAAAIGQAQQHQPAPLDPLTEALRKAQIAMISRNMERLMSVDAPEQNGPTPAQEEKSVIAKFLLAEPAIRDQAIRNLIGSAQGPDGTPELTGWQWVFLKAVENPQVLQMALAVAPQLLQALPGLKFGPRAPEGVSQAVPTPKTGASGPPAALNGALAVRQRPAPAPQFTPPSGAAYAPPAADERPGAQAAPVFHSPLEDDGEENEMPTANDPSRDTYFMALDALIGHIADNEPISAGAEWLAVLRERFPEQIGQALTMVKIFDVTAIKGFLKMQDESYIEPLQRPHVDEWLEQFKALVMSGALG